MRGGADAVTLVASRARSPPDGVIVTAVGIFSLLALATPRARPPTPPRMTRSVPTSASPLTTFVVSTSDVGDGTRARKTRFSASPDGDPLTYREVLRLWRADRAFRDVFLRALADEPHAAFFYETPPVTRDTLDRPYEHVITDAPALVSLPPEPHPFREHLEDARARGEPVAVFLNLGGDATPWRQSTTPPRPPPPRPARTSPTSSAVPTLTHATRFSARRPRWWRRASGTRRRGCPRTARGYRGYTSESIVGPSTTSTNRSGDTDRARGRRTARAFVRGRVLDARYAPCSYKMIDRPIRPAALARALPHRSPLVVLALTPAPPPRLPVHAKHPVIITTHIVRKLGSLAFPAKARHAMTSALSGTRKTDVMVARR